jgi:hypothetical protein
MQFKQSLFILAFLLGSCSALYATGWYVSEGTVVSGKEHIQALSKVESDKPTEIFVTHVTHFYVTPGTKLKAKICTVNPPKSAKKEPAATQAKAKKRVKGNQTTAKDKRDTYPLIARPFKPFSPLLASFTPNQHAVTVPKAKSLALQIKIKPSPVNVYWMLAGTKHSYSVLSKFSAKNEGYATYLFSLPPPKLV